MGNRPLYTQFAEHYDALFGGVDNACLDFVQTTTPPPARLLDAGCGTGQYAATLARRGYDVVAIDREMALIKARWTSRAFDFVLSDLRWLPFRGRFDIALARGVLNDFGERDDLIIALRSLAASLRRGGLLVADVRERDSHRRIVKAKPIVERQADAIVFRACRTMTNNGVIVSSEQFCLGGRWTDPFDFRMRTFTEKEARSLCLLAGLRTITVSQSYGPDSRLENRLIVVASPAD